MLFRSYRFWGKQPYLSGYAVYQSLEEAYEQAETYFPTRFLEYEAKSRRSNFQVKNNFYHLFSFLKLTGTDRDCQNRLTFRQAPIALYGSCKDP